MNYFRGKKNSFRGHSADSTCNGTNTYAYKENAKMKS